MNNSMHCSAGMRNCRSPKIESNTSACLQLIRNCLDKPEGYWNNILWINETKVKSFNFGEKKTFYFIINLKHGGVLVLASFDAPRPGQIVITDAKMNSELYQLTLKKNIRTSVCVLNLKRKWVMQQNNPQHTRQFTKEWWKKKRKADAVLEWPIQSPHSNTAKKLWNDLKRAVHMRKPFNIPESRLQTTTCRYCSARGSHKTVKTVHILSPSEICNIGLFFSIKWPRVIFSFHLFN